MLRGQWQVLQSLTTAVDFGRVIALVSFYQIWTLLTRGQKSLTYRRKWHQEISNGSWLPTHHSGVWFRNAGSGTAWLWHSESSDLQPKKLGSLCFKKKIKRGEVVPVHAVKAYRGSRCIAPLVLYFGFTLGEKTCDARRQVRALGLTCHEVDTRSSSP